MRVDDALPVPLDVRLMNATASVLFVVVGLLGLAGASLWVLRHPWFSIAAITVRGDLGHNNAMTLRTNVMPHLAGNFFTLNLDSTREAFEAVPWVRKAVIWREFPNRLTVQLQEHQPVAYWGAEGDTRMLNNFGEVFDTAGTDMDVDDLPRLNGPQDQPTQMLAMYRALFPLFQTMDATLDRLELSERGSWRAQLNWPVPQNMDTVVELGRGTQAEVVERTRRFTRSATQVTAQYTRSPHSIESADLRHGNGYALRLRGVTTVMAADAAKPASKVAVNKVVTKPASRLPGTNR